MNNCVRYFGEKLSQLRISKGLSLRELEKQTGISKSSLNYYENAKVDPQLSNVIKLAHFFNVDINWFIGVDIGEDLKVARWLQWDNETALDNIRPDALAYIEENGILFTLFIEIHVGNKFDSAKYVNFLEGYNLKDIFPVLPRIIICTDRNLTLPKMQIKHKIVNLAMEGLDCILK